MTPAQHDLSDQLAKALKTARKINWVVTIALLLVAVIAAGLGHFGAGIVALAGAVAVGLIGTRD